MTPAEFEHWQTTLLPDGEALAQLLALLQKDWLNANAALRPATTGGNDDEARARVTTLSRQIRVIEQQLIK